MSSSHASLHINQGHTQNKSKVHHITHIAEEIVLRFVINTLNATLLNMNKMHQGKVATRGSRL